MRIWLWNPTMRVFGGYAFHSKKMRIVIPISIFGLTENYRYKVGFDVEEKEKTLVLIQNTVVMLHGLKSRT